MKKTLKYISILAALLLFTVLTTFSFSPEIRHDLRKFTEETGIHKEPSWVGLYLSGYHAAKNKDYANASKYFAGSYSVRADPTFLEPQTLTLLLVAGRYEEAREVAAKLINKDNSSLANLTVIAGHINDGNFQKADAELNRVELNKQNTVIHKLLQAWVKLGAGKPLAAQTIIESLQKQKGMEQIGAYHYALIADMVGNKKLAESLYDNLAEKPNLPSSVAAGAYKFYSKNGITTKAKNLLDKFSDSDKLTKYHAITNAKDGAAEAFLGIAGIIMAEYGEDKSASFFRLALYLNHNLDEAKILLGTVLINEGDFAGANKILAQIDKGSYLSDYAQLAIARNFESMEDTTKARSAFKNLLESKNAKVEAMISLGDLERKDENWDKAIDYYTDAIAEIQKATKVKLESKFWAIYFARGICFERTKNWVKAEADFYAALRLSPDEPEVLNYLGYSWLEMDEKIPDALAIIQKAYNQQPDDPHIIDSLGWAYFKMGNNEKAVELLEAASTKMAYDPVVNNHLGDVYWRLGRKTEAQYAWRRALDNNPEKRFVTSLKQKLEKGLNLSAK